MGDIVSFYCNVYILEAATIKCALFAQSFKV